MVKVKYVPILKLKAAELSAVKTLSDADKYSILPFFEAVPSYSIPKKYLDISGGDLSKYNSCTKVELDAQNLLTSFGDGVPFIFDTSLLLSNYRQEYLKNFINNSAKLYLNPIFAISSFDFGIAASIKHYCVKYATKPLFCMRINIKELDDINSLKMRLSSLLDLFDFYACVVDLQSSISDDNYKVAARFLSELSIIFGDDTLLIVSGGSFPKDMSRVRIDASLDERTISRSDYLNWRKIKNSCDVDIIFSDYSIRHPIYDPSVEFHQSSSTIKYTVGDSWIIYKGSASDKIHYLANAKILADSGEFYGKEHCSGDLFIHEKKLIFEKEGVNSRSTGNATNWLAAGISHHIKVTIDQI